LVAGHGRGDGGLGIDFSDDAPSSRVC
jgi:hypothetical protein